MPGLTTVIHWLSEKDEFRVQYDEARRIQAEKYAKEIVDIADDSSEDYGFKASEDGSGRLR